LSNDIDANGNGNHKMGSNNRQNEKYSQGNRYQKDEVTIPNNTSGSSIPQNVRPNENYIILVSPKNSNVNFNVPALTLEEEDEHFSKCEGGPNENYIF
jgi:hypothetical protein